MFSKKNAYPDCIVIKGKMYNLVDLDDYATYLNMLKYDIFTKWIKEEYIVYREADGFLPMELLKLNIKGLHVEENYDQFIKLFKDTLATATAVRFYDLISEIYTRLPFEFIETFEGKLYYSLINILKIMKRKDLELLIIKLPWYWILHAYSVLFTIEDVKTLTIKNQI